MWCIKNHPYKEPESDKNISMQTFSKEFIPIPLDNHLFENQNIRNDKWTFLHVQPVNIPIKNQKTYSVLTELSLFWSQAGIKFQCNEEITLYLETNSQTQVKNHRLTPWTKNESGRVEETWVWLSRHVKTDSTLWRFWSIKIPLH